jgi:hypothetical protein
MSQYCPICGRKVTKLDPDRESDEAQFALDWAAHRCGKSTERAIDTAHNLDEEQFLDRQIRHSHTIASNRALYDGLRVNSRDESIIRDDYGRYDDL